MADKAISELIAAEQIMATDMFVLEQNGTAKKLTGQVLLNWLAAAADGHGGIQSIIKLNANGLTDTYRITLADTTLFDFVVTNGKGIRDITKTATSGLVDTYSVTYNDGTTTTFTVTNGEKGDKGDNTYLWIKYASQEPTADSYSFGDVPDNWIGIYVGILESAPTDWQQYRWFKIKGEKGDKGDPATLVSSTTEYLVSDSGKVIPSGSWTTAIPSVAQGKYLWTRVTQIFNTGNPVISYSISRMGIDGLGSVQSVAGLSPNADGNVELKPSDIGAVATDGSSTMTGALAMGGNRVTGVRTPTDDGDAANKEYVDGKYFSATATLLASEWQGGSAPYTQTISLPGILATDKPHISPVYSGELESDIAMEEACTPISRAYTGDGTVTFVCFQDKPGMDIPVQVEVNR